MIQNYEIPVGQYKVLVTCMTYNQSRYIEEALNGFVMQKTNFPFLCLVMDDASTDGEQDVIRAWMERECDMSKAERYDIPESEVVVVPHIANDNCTMAFYFLKNNLFERGGKAPLINLWREHCEYEAMCEGDDYWTDSRKLGMQVAFLESHPGYSFCCHRFKIYDQNKDVFLKEYGAASYASGMDLEIDESVFTKVWVTQILTTMVPISYYRALESYIEKYSSFRDVHMYYYLLKMGRGISLNEEMGVYRWHDGGVASSISGEQRYRKQYSIYKELLNYNQDDEFLKLKVQYNLIRLLRHVKLSKVNNPLFKEAMKFSRSAREILNIVLSYFAPPPIVEKLESKFRENMLAKQVIH